MAPCARALFSGPSPQGSAAMPQPGTRMDRAPGYALPQMCVITRSTAEQHPLCLVSDSLCALWCEPCRR